MSGTSYKKKLTRRKVKNYFGSAPNIFWQKNLKINYFRLKGLVTPCDHGSIYGGVKPLRQQQQHDEKHVNFYDDNSAESDIQQQPPQLPPLMADEQKPSGEHKVKDNSSQNILFISG